MDLGFVGKVVVVTGASKGIGYACAEAFAREGARVALVSRSDANLDAALARIPAGAHAPRKYMADLRARGGRRPHDRQRRTRHGSDRRARQLGRRGPPLRAGRPRRRRVARGDGCEVFQLHPSDRRGAAAHGRSRARKHRQHHRLGRQGREPRAPAGRRRQLRAHAGDRRPRRRVRTEGRPDQRHQSRGNAHRTRAGRSRRGGEDDGPRRGRAAASNAGEDSARSPRHAGGSRAGCAVPRVRRTRAMSPAPSFPWTAERTRSSERGQPAPRVVQRRAPISKATTATFPEEPPC